MKQIKVRFITNFPLSVVYGGFEHQCVQTCIALKSIGIDAELLNWHGTEKGDFILHLFVICQCLIIVSNQSYATVSFSVSPDVVNSLTVSPSLSISMT